MIAANSNQYDVLRPFTSFATILTFFVLSFWRILNSGSSDASTSSRFSVTFQAILWLFFWVCICLAFSAEWRVSTMFRWIQAQCTRFYAKR